MNLTIDNTIAVKTCVFYDTEFKRMTRFPSKIYFVNVIVSCVANILLALSTISLNALTLMACWKSKKLREKKSYFLIALLSLNDLTFGLLGSPGVIALMVKTLLKTEECISYFVVKLIASCLLAMSFATLFLLNLERYLCIAHPLSSEQDYKVAPIWNSIGSLDGCNTSCAITIIHGYSNAIFDNRGLNLFHSLIWVHVRIYISRKSKDGKRQSPPNPNDNEHAGL